MNSVDLDREEVYDILYGSSLFESYTKEYGTVTVLEEDEIMDDFVPRLIEYINSKLISNNITNISINF